MPRNIITKSNPASETTYAYGGHELLSPAKYAQQLYNSIKIETAKLILSFDGVMYEVKTK